MSDDPLLGTYADRYRFVRVLGRGGMGTVYEAAHATVGSSVAIKVIAERYAREREQLDRFFAEARAVNLIRHENIVKVIDLSQLPDGRPYIVMELVDGRTLRDHMREPLPLGGVVHAIVDVLSALAAAHAIGIVHRDLKPDNIIVTSMGNAKVLDFGIAKLVALPGQALPRTQTGVVLGTPEYMSPEQIHGGAIDARTDLYALGVVLYEAIAGRRPFVGASDFEVMRAHVDDAPPPLAQFRPGIPTVLEEVIACALAKRPQDRFANAAAMAHALRGAAAALPESERRSLVPRGKLRLRPQSQQLPPIAPPTKVTVADRPVVADRPITKPTVADRPARPIRRRWPLVAVPLALVGGVIAVATLSTSSSSTAPSISAPTPVAETKAWPLPGPSIRMTDDPKRFDPIAHFEQAEALAKQVMPDPAVYAITFAKATPEGVPLTTDPYGNFYMFRSRTRTTGTCAAIVYVTTTVMHAYPSDYGCVAHPSEIRPGCTWAQLWDVAREKVGNGPVMLQWTTQHGWALTGYDKTYAFVGRRCETRETPEVVEATKPPRTPVTSSSSLDAFDHRAFLPKAHALALAALPGVHLESIVLQPVLSDGRVDLTKQNGQARYLFQRSYQAGDPCQATVIVDASGVHTKTWSSGTCGDDPRVRVPSCSLRALRASVAKAVPQAKNEIARVTIDKTGYLFDSESAKGPFKCDEAAASSTSPRDDTLDNHVSEALPHRTVPDLYESAQKVATRLHADAKLVEIEGPIVRDEVPVDSMVVRYYAASANACIVVSVLHWPGQVMAEVKGECSKAPLAFPRCAPTAIALRAQKLGQKQSIQWSRLGWSVTGIEDGRQRRYVFEDDC